MLKIGEKIKELRKTQNTTQEKLAEYLNISYQAVSKWENGLALPDITLLPKLAGFFGVSCDELLNISTKENELKLKKYEEQYQELNRKGKVLEIIELSQKVLEEYPRNFQWMLNLAYGLVSYSATAEQEKYSKENNFVEKAIDLCERILEDCTIDSIRHSATQILCYNYPSVDKKEEAVKLAESMPDMLLCREALLSRIFTGKDCLKQNQRNLIQMIDYCSGILYEMACRSDLRQELNTDERVRFIETAIKLYQIVLDGDENSLFYNCRLSLYYLMIAKLYCQKGKDGNAIKYLLLSEKCAVNYDSIVDLGEQKYNSIFLNRMTWNPKSVGTNWDGTLQEQLLYSLEDDCFNLLNDNEEFKKLKSRLK